MTETTTGDRLNVRFPRRHRYIVRRIKREASERGVSAGVVVREKLQKALASDAAAACNLQSQP